MPITKKLDVNDDVVLASYIGGLVDNNIHHVNYKDNVEQAQQMGVHLKGDKPGTLLTKYRPNEDPKVAQYRIEIYEPITQSQGRRIINVVSKIQQSSNYSIKFPEQERISKEDNLQTYTQEDYPVFGSVENWAFSIALQQDLLDSNSLVVVMPLEIPENDVSFLNPFTFIYRSDQVLDYGYNYYTILLDEKNIVNEVNLNIWLLVTDTQILKITQIDPTKLSTVEIEVLYTYNFGEVPAYFLKGDYREETMPYAYNSFISGILPYWNTAIRVNSDLDIQYVNHFYLERVEVKVDCDNDCSKNEEGVFVVERISNGNPVSVACQRCKGTGTISGRSPSGVTQVKADEFDVKDPIFPGVTYVTKPTDIIELTEKKISSLISQGFSAVNLDIIDKVGENQSGVAKTIDRGELNSFLNKVSDNLFDNIIKHAFRYISLWRFGVIDEVTFPVINKPTNFSALSDSMIVDEIKMLNEAGIDTTQWELELVSKKFPNDKEKLKLNKAIIELDPLSGKKEEDKMNILMARGVTQEQYIISSNIRGFILNALEKDSDFLDKNREEKQKTLIELAKAQIVMPIVINSKDGSTEADTEDIE